MEVKTVIHATNIGNNIADAKMNFVMINGEDVNVPFNSKKFLSTEDGIVLEGRDAEATIKEHQQKIAQTNNYFMKKVNNEEDESDEEFSYRPGLKYMHPGIATVRGKYAIHIVTEKSALLWNIRQVGGCKKGEQ